MDFTKIYGASMALWACEYTVNMIHLATVAGFRMCGAETFRVSMRRSRLVMTPYLDPAAVPQNVIEFLPSPR